MRGGEEFEKFYVRFNYTFESKSTESLAILVYAEVGDLCVCVNRSLLPGFPLPYSGPRWWEIGIRRLIVNQ